MNSAENSVSDELYCYWSILKDTEFLLQKKLETLLEQNVCLDDDALENLRLLRLHFGADRDWLFEANRRLTSIRTSQIREELELGGRGFVCCRCKSVFFSLKEVDSHAHDELLALVKAGKVKDFSVSCCSWHCSGCMKTFGSAVELWKHYDRS